MNDKELIDFIDDLWKKEMEFLNNFSYVSSGGISKQNFANIAVLINRVAKQGMKIVEIGSWTGVSSSLLASFAKKYNGILYCVDWFLGNENTHLKTEARYFNIENILIDNLKNVEVDGFVKIIRKKSEDAVKNLTSSFDFIFLDGDHCYEAFKADIRAWFPKLSSSGIICGHDCDVIAQNWEDLWNKIKHRDCSHLHLGVTKALWEELPGAKLTDENDVIWYLQK